MFVSALSREADADELHAALEYLTELTGDYGVAAVDISGK
jgi:hypothetical protein